jgi:hypothetical protein
MDDQITCRVNDKPRLRFRLRTLFIITTVIAAILGIAVWPFVRAMNGVRNAYAVWWAADMVVEHLKANDGAWPQDWDDLQDDYQTCVKRSGQPWSFDELQSRVVVDWHADPKQLASLANSNTVPPFRVIWLADGTDNYWESNEPNQIIADYLKSSK